MDQNVHLAIQAWYFHFINRKYFECMTRAEELYAKRDRNWTFSGFTFDLEGPQTRYPAGRDKKYIGIELHVNAICDEQRSIFQIAHEVVHCLAPSVIGGAPLLEEGAAVALSLDAELIPDADYRRRCEAGFPDNYREALELYKELVAIDPSAIRTLRNKSVSFDALTPSIVRRWIPRVPAGLAEALCERRRMRDTAIAPPA